MLSIIIINYKSWEVLDKCLASFKQYPPKIDYEIMVVDNDSQDGQFNDFKERHPEITLIANSSNHGFSHGCNLGTTYAKGEYLLFLNPDTELTPDNAIDAMVNFLKNHSSVGIVSCRRVNSNGKIEREIFFNNPWFLNGWIKQIYKIIYKKHLKKIFFNQADVWYSDGVSGSVLLIKSSLFKQVDGWQQDRYWMYHEDPDICNKVNNLGKKSALLRNKTIKHIGGGVSRKNSKITVVSKTQVLISAHNYIQVNTAGFECFILHLFFMVNTLLSLLIKMSLSVIFLRIFKAKIYFLTIFFMIKYYFFSLICRTWKSPRLKK